MDKNKSKHSSAYYYELNMLKELLNMNLISFDEYTKIIDIISDSYKNYLYNA